MKYNPIILALDYSNLFEARELLPKVRPYIGMIKIGLELFTACGKEALQLSKDFDIPIFLDLKLHDIPKTVEKTVGVICEHLSHYNGNHFLSIHCSGGSEMCRSALQASTGSNVNITGVSLLTSLDKNDLIYAGLGRCQTGMLASDLALMGANCLNDDWVFDQNGNLILSGLNSFVCGGRDLKRVKKYLGKFQLICPGIRLNNDKNDHKDVKTVSFALKNGATWLVIGRPITQAENPIDMAKEFYNQIISL